MNRRVGSCEESPVGSLNDNTVWQPSAEFRRHLRFECLPLERCETKRISGAIVLEHEFHGAVAQGAVSVVKENFGFFVSRRHSSEENNMDCA